jgi:hypothetical protein
MWNYIPNLATVFLAVLQLAKDWGAHQTTWRRAGVLCLIVLLGVGGTINAYYSRRNANVQHNEDQKRIAGLQTAVETAKEAQENNTKQFLQSLSDLSQKLSDLQSQVKTSGLQKEAAQLKAELESTQKALTPQKAELEASLGNVTDKLENLDVKELSVVPDPDGTVTFTLSVVNKSGVQARSGSIFLRICEECSFTEEPTRFIKPVGAISTDREMMFQSIAAITGIAVPLKIKPPQPRHRFEIAVTLRCENCTVSRADLLHINY